MSPSTRLILLRHGEVADPWRGRIYGGLDVPLSERGEEDARVGARGLEGLELDAVVSSGLSRAEATAACLRETRPHLARRDVPALREIDRGAWAGRPIEELEAEWPVGVAAWRASQGRLAPPGGEPLERMAARVLPALDALAREHPGGTVAIVAHLWVLRLTACEALDLPRQRCTRLAVPYGGKLVVDWPVDRAVGSPRMLALEPLPGKDRTAPTGS